MASETYHICDSCHDRVAGDFPASWKRVSIRLSEEIDDEDATTVQLANIGADLCQRCFGELETRCDPSTWGMPKP